MVLTIWIDGYRHDVGTNEAFDLVLGVAAGNIELRDWVTVISAHLVPRQDPQGHPAGPGL